MAWLDEEIHRIRSRQYQKGCRWKYFLLGAISVLVLISAVFFLITYATESDVVVIRVDGTIMSGNFYGGGYAGSEYVGRQLRSAADDPMTSAIVLRVNSPGGTPSGAQEIIADIEYAKSKKPVVASMGDIATSAAYHICSHTDLIYANPDTMTGSIGTIWTFYDVSGSLEDEGVVVDVVKSGEKKDLGSQFRPLSDEERKFVQGMVNASFERFVSDVIEERGIERALVEDARLFSGEEALKVGLVDRTGNLYDAVSGARELAASV